HVSFVPILGRGQPDKSSNLQHRRLQRVNETSPHLGRVKSPSQWHRDTSRHLEQSLVNIPSGKNHDLPTTRNRQHNDQDNCPEHDQGRTHSASESFLYQLRNMVPCKPQYTIPSTPRRAEIPVKSLRANPRPDRKV